MSLTLLLKFCLGLVSIASVSSAIGVPVLLRTRGKTDKVPNLMHGGGRSAQLSLSRCSDLNRGGKPPIDFGAEPGNNVCWTVDSDTQLTDSGVEFNLLFQKQWENKAQDWSQGVEGTNWVKECMGEEKPVQWAIQAGGSNDAQYLGQCGGSSVRDTKFVKKEQKGIENIEAWTLSLCDRECWKSSDSGLLSGSPEVLQEEKGDNWREVKFYR